MGHIRELTSHRVNGLNEAIRIFVLDEPGSGNACHEYLVCVPFRKPYEGEDDKTSMLKIREWQKTVSALIGRIIETDGEAVIAPGSPWLCLELGVDHHIAIFERHAVIEDHTTSTPRIEYFKTQHISFQDGPIKEAGYNGNSHEALLAILLDRMEGFQGGPFQCHDNAVALDHLQSARLWLHKRTMDRMARNVEGTHQK